MVSEIAGSYNNIAPAPALHTSGGVRAPNPRTVAVLIIFSSILLVLTLERRLMNSGSLLALCCFVFLSVASGVDGEEIFDKKDGISKSYPGNQTRGGGYATSGTKLALFTSKSNRHLPDLPDTHEKTLTRLTTKISPFS
jgi:hypothetical protein